VADARGSTKLLGGSLVSVMFFFNFSF